MTSVDERLNELIKKYSPENNVAGRGLGALYEGWKQLVEECENGYEWDRSEFANDASSRVVLQQIFDDPEASHIDEIKDMKQIVLNLDKRMSKTTMDDEAKRLNITS